MTDYRDFRSRGIVFICTMLVDRRRRRFRCRSHIKAARKVHRKIIYFSSTAEEIMTVIKVTTARNQYNVVTANPPTSKLQYFRRLPPSLRTVVFSPRTRVTYDGSAIIVTRTYALYRDLRVFGTVLCTFTHVGQKSVLNFTVRRPPSDFNECADKCQEDNTIVASP